MFAIPATSIQRQMEPGHCHPARGTHLAEPEPVHGIYARHRGIQSGTVTAGRPKQGSISITSSTHACCATEGATITNSIRV